MAEVESSSPQPMMLFVTAWVLDDSTTGTQRQRGVLGPDKELDEAIEWFHRHAYDLNLLRNYLAKCTTDHDIQLRHRRGR